MDRWGNLNMQQKARLLGIYASKGYTDLASIINHYNTFQAGGKLTFEQWKSQMQSKYPDIEMDNTKAGYDYVRYFNDNYDDAIKQLSKLGHFPDTYKLPNHRTFSNESIYSRGPMMGGNWVNDSTFSPSIINRQQYPNIYKEDRPYTEREIYGSEYQQGGSLGKVTPLGQWQYPHEVTTIPSNNITMKGVDYPVLGISDTGDTKYMLPNMDYLFDGNYVTEYPLHKFQRGGNTDGISSGRWRQIDDETVTPEYALPPVTVEAEHPLWSLPWYKDKKSNPNINRYKDQLYNNWRRHNEAGKEYLKRVAGGLSVTALPIGGVAGFVLGIPDLATDFAEMMDKPSVSNTIELGLDAPTRYGTELDNALISVLKSNRYTKPLAKILQYNDALQYIGAANDASSAITGKSIIEHAKR